MLEEVLDQGVRDGQVPGGQLVVGVAGDVVHRQPFGVTRVLPPGSGAPVTMDVVYDVASLTKPIATVAVVMRLVDAGKLDLDAPVRQWVPELAHDDLTPRDLLAHTSGFPAHVKLYERILAGERLGAPSAREAMLRMVCATPRSYEPRTRSIYSDLGFVLLGFACERAGGDRLDRLADALVFEPLGMRSTFVDLERDWRPSPVAPTEDCPYRGLVDGEVHDQNTHAAGGILGQAGLFSTADDVARFARAILAGTGGFSHQLTREFLAPAGIPGSRWGLGWDHPDPEPGVSQAGDLWPRDSAGHLGFTGCSMWLHPPTGRFAILLTNMIHPVIDLPRNKRFRRAVMDAVVTSIAP